MKERIKMTKKRGLKGKYNEKKKNIVTRIANFNVHGKLGEDANRQKLMQEFKDRKISVAVIQETHWDTDELNYSIPGLGRLINFKATTDNNHKKYGMGFWISSEWEKRFMGVERINDRIAAIKLKILKDGNDEKKCLIIGNVYGPTSTRTRGGQTEECKMFYAELKQAMSKWRKTAAIMMIGGDLNSKIGQQTEEDKDIMGKHSKGQRNQHGIYLSEFLKEERMFLCNTAFQHRDHHIATWHSSIKATRPDGTEYNKGIHNQIDFMMIPQRLKNMVTDSRAYHTKYESDHSIVITDIRLKALYPMNQTKVDVIRKKDLGQLWRNEELNNRYKAKVEELIVRKAANNMAANEFMRSYREIAEEEEEDKRPSMNEEHNMEIEAMKEAIEQIVPDAPRIVGGRIIYDKDPELKKLSKMRQKLWQTFKNQRATETKRKRAVKERKEIIKKMRSRIRQLNDERYNNIADEIESHDRAGSNKSVYEFTRIMTKKAPMRIIVEDEDGFLTTGPMNLMKAGTKHYMNKFAKRNDDTIIYPIAKFIGDPRRLNQEIATEEVMTAIKRLRNNRSTGPDGVSNEWYKYAGPNVGKKLTDRFNRMMEEHNVIEAIETGLLIPLNKEGARKIWDKTRPIVLLNSIRKILCLVVLKRIDEKIEKYLSPGQHGYRSGRSTTEVAWTTQYLKAICEKFKEEYAVIQTDMSQAFDTPDRGLLMEILETEVKIGEDELRLIRVLLAEVKLQLKIDNIKGEQFTSLIGVPQGDGLSPKLFLVYMEHIRRKYVERSKKGPWDINTTFADDDMHFYHMTTEEKERKSTAYGPCMETCKCCECRQRGLLYGDNSLTKKMEECKMKMNPEKTKFTIMSRDRTTKLFQLGNEMNAKEELYNRTRRGFNACEKLNGIWIKKTRISLKTRIKLYKTMAVPHLMYNTHAIGMNKSQVDKLNRQHRKHLRKVMGIYWPDKIGVRTIYRKTGTRAISTDITKRRWEFLGHILRLSVPREASGEQPEDEAVNYEKLCEKVVEIPAYKAMLIYYAETIPSGESTIAGKKREKPQAGVYKNLPKVLDEELKLIPRNDRSKLTGGVIKGVTQLTNLKELKLMRILAQDRKKWRALVERIVEEAEKKWRREERKRLQKKRNKRAEEMPEPVSEDEGEEDDRLYPVIIEMPPARRRRLTRN